MIKGYWIGVSGQGRARGAATVVHAVIRQFRGSGGFRGLGFRGLGFRGLGFRGLGFREELERFYVGGGEEPEHFFIGDEDGQGENDEGDEQACPFLGMCSKDRVSALWIPKKTVRHLESPQK